MENKISCHKLYFWGILLTVMVIISTLHPSWAAYSVTPRITAMGLYDSNIFLDPNNEESDFITTIAPGISFSSYEKRWVVDLSYDLNLVFFTDNDDLNYVGHDGRLDAWYDVSKYVRLQLTDALIRSDDPRDRYEEDDTRVSRGRSIYTRNTLTPSVKFKLAKSSDLELAYTNTYYTNDDPTIADSRQDYYHATLNHQFNIRHGVMLSGGYFEANFDDTDPPSPTEDFTGYDVGGSYTYSFTKHTKTTLDANYTTRDFEDDTSNNDYSVFSGGIGISHEFTRTFSTSARAGYYHREEDEADSNDGFEFSASLNQTGRKYSVNLNFFAGYREDYFDRENLGFVEVISVRGDFTYNVLRNMDFNAHAAYADDDYPDSNRDRQSWELGAKLDYLVLKWLAVEAGYDYLDRTSNDPDDEYTDHRIFLSLVVFYVYPPAAAR